MWTFVIIALVIAMMIGPVMLMQPSQAQRKLAALRLTAQQKGLQISASQQKTPEGSLCWLYWRRLPEKHGMAHCKLERKNYDHGLHIEGRWAALKPVDADDALKHLLRGLPESVYGVEVNATMVGVHWSERGGEAVLGSIVQLINHFVDEAALQVQHEKSTPDPQG